jgi:hypothetical protein
MNTFSSQNDQLNKIFNSAMNPTTDGPTIVNTFLRLLESIGMEMNYMDEQGL